MAEIAVVLTNDCKLLEIHSGIGPLTSLVVEIVARTEPTVSAHFQNRLRTIRMCVMNIILALKNTLAYQEVDIVVHLLLR